MKELKPLVSLVVPAYNESALIADNLEKLRAYMDTLSNYRWELIIVDDGSTDATGEIADRFAEAHENVSVLHHPSNFGLGQALRYGFSHCKGNHIVTLDVDLSYAPHHVAALLDAMETSKAKVVAASPYMKGGSIDNVPTLRKLLSTWANKFLSFAAKGNLSTLTGMVRAYDRRFIQSLTLRSTGNDINPEIIHKTLLLNGKIEEAPARLDWGVAQSDGRGRVSSMRISAQMASVLLSGFLFRPVIFFIVPGLALLVFAMYTGVWSLIHVVNQWPNFADHAWALDRGSAALAAAFDQFPHTFIVGAMSLMLAIQLLSLGILSLQSKSYFEEIFFLGASTYREQQKVRD